MDIFLNQLIQYY